MINYEQWNKAIISYFFEDREPDEKVFLHVTSDTLPEIAEYVGLEVEDAKESLVKTVRKKVIIKTLFPTDEIWLRNISPAEKDPPHVAFLALCVLAASNMGESEEVLRTNYYVPLNLLLFNKSIEGIPKGLNRIEWEKHWIYLQDWVRENYDVEFHLTIGHPKYVWYPISQCLISSRDRRNIYLFFQHLNLTPFSEVQDEKLETDLHVWLSASSGSAKIERYFSNETYKQSILNQVKSLLEHWDGVIPPEPRPGQRQLTSQIRVECRFNQKNGSEIRYWLQRRGRDEIGLEDNLLGINSLKIFNSEKWYRPQIDKKNAFWNLLNDVQLQTDEIKPIVYTLSRSDIWVFRKEKECDDGWISQRNMHLNEDHYILFHKRLQNAVLTCLRQTCEHELEEPIPINKTGTKKDWYYLTVTPTKLRGFDDPNLWKLSVDPSNKISFNNGLSVKDKNGHRAYLDICLPKVSLPDLGNSNDLSLQIGEQTFSVGEDRLVRLENKLGVGNHQLSYGKKTRELRVITPEHPLEQPEKTLIASLSDQGTIPSYSEERIHEINEKSGVWLTGAKFYGKDIPDGKLPHVPNPNQSIIPPAHLISSVIKLAIELKEGNSSIPDWFDEAFKSIDNNITLQTLVQKKLRQYKGKALSYEELCKQGGE